MTKRVPFEVSDRLADQQTNDALFTEQAAVLIAETHKTHEVYCHEALSN